MKILITGNSMDNYSGQPMSTYESARVLSRDHDVTVCTKVGRMGDNELTQNLRKLGVKCSYEVEPEYDLIIASEWMPKVKGYKINTVRGIYWDEYPIPGCDWYVCIRPDVQKHIVYNCSIRLDRTTVIYNGVDRTRFKPVVKSKRDYAKIVAPCNLDKLRNKWLNHMIDGLSEERQLFIYAKDKVVPVKYSPYVHMCEPTFEMEHVIACADLVVGIYLGRVNLEAASCRVMSEIYDPVTLKMEQFLPDEEHFDDIHNIENTVKRIMKLYYER